MIHPIGLSDHHGHGVLVLRSGDGEDGQSGQRQVIHTTANAALVVAVRIQATKKTETRELISDSWLHVHLRNDIITRKLPQIQLNNDVSSVCLILWKEIYVCGI